MGAKIGTGDVSFRLGSATPAAVYLGSEQVWSAATVPGAPTLLNAIDAGGDAEITYEAPADDGGSAITSYKFYADGVVVVPIPQSAGYALLGGISAGAVIQVSAVNAVGEGPKSNTGTVT